MDFEAYETFLENLSSVMRGIDHLIQKAGSKSGKRFVWSPVAPDIIEEGTLDYVEWGFTETEDEAIPQVILEYLNSENFIVELVCMNTDSGSYYILSIGH